MADDREFGDIATKLLMENDRVRIWEMRLEPGERSKLHRHDSDYIMVQIAGDKMAADFEPDSGGPWGTAGLAYPTVDLPAELRDRSYEDRWPVAPAEFDRLRDQVAPLFWPELLVSFIRPVPSGLIK